MSRKVEPAKKYLNEVKKHLLRKALIYNENRKTYKYLYNNQHNSNFYMADNVGYTKKDKQ